MKSSTGIVTRVFRKKNIGLIAGDDGITYGFCGDHVLDAEFCYDLSERRVRFNWDVIRRGQRRARVAFNVELIENGVFQ